MFDSLLDGTVQGGLASLLSVLEEIDGDGLQEKFQCGARVPG